MASAVSLNDVARMLSTKGGDISTIGGAIGCMTAMISGDARDKENTTSNDVRKIKEFICGDGGSLSSMIDRIQLAIAEQTVQVQQFMEGNKEKKLVKNDITKIIQSATSGLEKRLDNILDSLRLIAKNQGGNIKWGSTKKTKDSIEQFKASLSDTKKLKDSRIGKFVSMLTELKAISFKDLLMFKPKMMLLGKLNPQIDSFAKGINAKNVAKVSDFLQKAPKMFEDLFKSIKLSKLIRPKDLDRFYKILGITDKKEPEKNTILGLIQSFAELDKATLDKSKKNIAMVFGMVRDICFGIGILVLFSPVILFAGLISKPLEWALFGFSKKGDGGIVGLFKKLAEKKNDIKEANKAIMWMSLGFATLGAGLGILFLLTKNIGWIQLAKVAAATLIFTGLSVLMGKKKDQIKDGANAMMWMALGVGTLGLGFGIMFALTKDVDWEQLAIVGVAVAGFGLITAILGQLSDSIKEGAKAMMWMALGVGVLGLGLGIMFKMTKDVTWEQMAMVGVSILGLGLVIVALGAINKSGLVMEGAIAMAVMGVCLIPFGFAMKLLMGSVKGLKWSEFGIFSATTLILAGAIIGLGALMCSGFGAIAWAAGLAAIGAMGLALIPFGIGMRQVAKAAKEIDNKSITNLAHTTKVLFDAFGDAADKKKRKNAKKNADTIKSIGKSLKKLGKALKSFNDVAPDSIDKTIKAVEKISEFFFGKDGISKYSTDWKKRIKSRAEANTIGNIAGIMHKLAFGLRTFNDVAPDSIEKAMNAINKIAFYFFSPDSELNKMNTGWLNRRKAEKTADAIGDISECVWKLAKGMKDFNEVAPSSIDIAKDAINKIAFYFFSPDSELNKMNTGYSKRKKARKTADTIGTIADSLYKVSQALKDFQDTGAVVDKMIETIDRIAVYFFRGSEKDVSGWKAYQIANAIELIGESIHYFDDETKDVDTNRMKEKVESFGMLTSQIFDKWKSEYSTAAKDINTSMRYLVDSFDDGGRKFRRNVKVTTNLFKQLAKPSFVAAGSTLRSATAFVKSVDTIDMEKAESLTDMFKSFASIGRTSSLFSNFDKRVKQFTEACIELVNAINGNTDAINNSEEEVTIKDASGEDVTVKRKDAELMPKQMTLLNVDDLAYAIADQLNNLNVDCDANINLQINNESGNEWRISRM